MPQLSLEDFIIGDVIGSGYNSTVYKAVKRDDGKNVVIKQRAIISSSDLDRVLHAFLGLEVCDAPNIVQTFSVFPTCGKGPYKYSSGINIVSEFCDWGSASILREQVSGLGMPVPSLCFFCSQVVEGLNYLHRRGIIHGNIKASNILLTSEGDVKLSDRHCSVDYGAETLAEESFALEEIILLAPEVFTGEDQCCFSDVWSFGMLSLCLAEGKIPDHFAALKNSSFVQLVRTLFEAEPPRLGSTSNPELFDFLFCCLTKELPKSKDAALIADSCSQRTTFPCYVVLTNLAGESLVGPLKFEGSVSRESLLLHVKKTGKLRAMTISLLLGTRELLVGEEVMGGSEEEPIVLTVLTTSGRARAHTAELLQHPFLSAIDRDSKSTFASWLATLLSSK